MKKYDSIDNLSLPQGWAVETVRGIIDKIPLTGKKLKLREYKTQGIFPVIDQGQQFIGGYENKKELLIECKLPVIVFGDHTKIIKFVDFKFIAGADGIKVIKPNSAFYPKLFYYFLQTIDLPERGYSRHFKFLEESKILIPPLEEQKRIVSKIEDLFKESKSVRHALDEIQTVMKKFRKSTISHFFTQNNDTTWIPLNHLLAEPLRNGKSALPSKNGNGIPILKLSAVTFKDFSSSNIKICDIKKEDVDNLWVRNNDVLIARANTIEYVGMGVIYEGANNRFIFPDLMIRVRVNEDIIRPKFLAFFLDSSLARDHFRKNAGGTAGSMPKISQGDIENLLVPVPSLPEQDLIVEKITESFSFADKIEKSIRDATKRTDKLDQAILAKAFRGELVPQDPNDEPASVLLERIKSEREQSEQKISRLSRKKMAKKLT